MRGVTACGVRWCTLRVPHLHSDNDLHHKHPCMDRTVHGRQHVHDPTPPRAAWSQCSRGQHSPSLLPAAVQHTTSVPRPTCMSVCMSVCSVRLSKPTWHTPSRRSLSAQQPRLCPLPGAAHAQRPTPNTSHTAVHGGSGESWKNGVVCTCRDTSDVATRSVPCHSGAQPTEQRLPSSVQAQTPSRHTNNRQSEQQVKNTTTPTQAGPHGTHATL